MRAPSGPVLQGPHRRTITHPCLGLTTARVTNGSSLTWIADPLVESASSTRPGTRVAVPAGSSATIPVGRALQGAEHFYLWATVTIGSSFTSTGADTPLILYSAACIPGHPATTFTAANRYSHDVLAATIKPAIPGGAYVWFYRLSGTTRILVGTATTNAQGIASVRIPHHEDAAYFAVIGATHYSLRTTTAVRSVN